MPERYRNFDIYLTWHPPAGDRQAGRVSVEHANLNNHHNPVPYFHPRENDWLSVLMTSVSKENMQKTWLIDAGERVADLLLPDQPANNIRQAFVDFCRTHINKDTGVRLRLFYPAASDLAKVDELTELMSIPWEYLYLEKPDNLADRPVLNFLGCNPDISIVNSFKSPVELNGAQPPHVGRLLVDLAYLSWLGRDETNQAQDMLMFNDFVDELGPLTTVVNTEFIGSTPDNFESRRPPIPADPDDVVQALLDNDIVHLVFHSEPSKIYLKGGQGGELTADELLTTFLVFQNEINAKLAILIGCNSGDGGRSVAAALHRANVPLVISFTASIKPEDARIFVNYFYRAFGAQPHRGLEQAMAQARLGMLQQSDDALLWFGGFGLPRLFMNVPNSVIIPESLLFASSEMVEVFDSYINNIPDPFNAVRINKDLDKIVSWVESPDAPDFYIIGRDGAGKSTLIAQAIRRIRNEQQNQVVIVHFGGQDSTLLPGHSADPLAFIRYSIAPQLDKSFANYRQLVPNGSFPLLVGNKLQALRDFVLKPLNEIVTPETRPLIVIDDIDIFRQGHGYSNSILKLINDYWGDLVNIAKWLIAANVSNPHAERKLADLLGEPDLSVLPELERVELVRSRFDTEVDDKIINLDSGVDDHYRPVPLVYDLANRFAKYLEFEQPLSIELAASSQGVTLLYQKAIESLEKLPDEQASPLVGLLEVIAISYEDLFPCDVAALVGADNIHIEQLTPFLADRENGEVNKPLQLFHDSLKNYLVHYFDQQGRQAAIHERFVEAVLPETGWAAITNWVSLTGTHWGESCLLQENKPSSKRVRRESVSTVAPNYVRRYLALHTYKAFNTTPVDMDENRRNRGEIFLALVCDPAFRTVRLVDGGRAAALEDMRNALRVTYSLRGGNYGYDSETGIAALDRLFATNDPLAEIRLLALEERIRLGRKKDDEDLLETFLWPEAVDPANLAQQQPTKKME